MPDKKKDESLEQGLSHSATKKGLTGPAKREYIGGAITNMRKKGRLPARAGAKKATSKTKGEALYNRLQRGETVMLHSPQGQTFEVKTRKFAGVTGYVISQNGKVVKEHKGGSIMPRSEAIAWLNGLKEKAAPKAPAKPKEPEKPKEDKTWTVEAQYKKPNKEKGYRYEDKYGDEEHTGLTEQQAKDMVNSKSNQGKYVSLSVYHNGRTYRSWQRVNREWRLYSTGSYMKL